ncbi:MAG TPA: protein kinase [Planctomycetota bacterium]|nr:protein kinase [Planctomycetota bacterium]
MSGGRPTIPGVTLDRAVAPPDGGADAVEYEGRQTYVDRPVVVRLLTERPRDAATVERFRRDAARLVAAAHPGIVECLDAGVTADGSAYLVFSRVEGPTLAEWLREGKKLAPPQALALVRALAAALRHAQAHELAHGAVAARHVRLDARGGGELPFTPRLAGFAVARGEATTPLLHAQDLEDLTRLARELGATAADGVVPSGLSWDEWIASGDAKLATRRPSTRVSTGIAVVLLAAVIWIGRHVRERYGPPAHPPSPTLPGPTAPSGTASPPPAGAATAIRVQRDRAREPFAPAREGERVAFTASAAAPAASSTSLRWQVLEPEGLVTAASKQDVLEFTVPFGLRQRRVRVRALADRTPPAPLEGTLEITAGEPAHAALPDDDAAALAGLGPDWYAGGDDPAARQSFGEAASVAAWSLGGGAPFTLELRLHREDATAAVASGARVEFGDASALELRLAVDRDERGGELRRARLLATRTRVPELDAASEPWPGAAARLLEIELPGASDRGLSAPDVLPPPLCARLRVAWDPEDDAFEVELAPELARWDAPSRRWTTTVGPAARQRVVWHEVTGRRLWLPARIVLFRPAGAGLCVHGVRRAD